MIVVGDSVAEWFKGTLHLKSGNPDFKSPSDHEVDLFVVPGATPRLCLYIVNWSA